MGKGEIYALIGPNGAGKSTTLRIVATILSPSDGKVTINNIDAIKNPDKVRQMISYLPEEAGAYKNLSGRDYLKLMANLYATQSSQVDMFVKEAVNIADLKERIDDKIRTYSKGMTRKLLLSRSVMTHPDLAILDEPTSGLDVINSVEIRDLIKRLAKTGMSVLLSSHNMLEIEYLSDRVGIINQGKLLISGTAEELKKRYSANNLEEVFIRETNK